MERKNNNKRLHPQKWWIVHILNSWWLPPMYCWQDYISLFFLRTPIYSDHHRLKKYFTSQFPWKWNRRWMRCNLTLARRMLVRRAQLFQVYVQLYFGFHHCACSHWATRKYTEEEYNVFKLFNLRSDTCFDCQTYLRPFGFTFKWKKYATCMILFLIKYEKLK